MENEVNILAEEKIRTVKLADGKEYTLPPIDLTTLANIEKTMGFSLSKFAVKLETETMSTMRSLFYALLKECYPDITIEKAGRLVGLKELNAVSDIISKILVMT